MNILKINYRMHHNVEHIPWETKLKVENTKKTYELVLNDLKKTIEDDLDIVIEEKEWGKAVKELLSFWKKERNKINIKISYGDVDDDVNFLETGEEINHVTLFAERKDGRENTLYCLGNEIVKNENRWFSFEYVPIEEIEKEKRRWEKIKIRTKKKKKKKKK